MIVKRLLFLACVLLLIAVLALVNEALCRGSREPVEYFPIDPNDQITHHREKWRGITFCKGDYGGGPDAPPSVLRLR